MPVTEQFLLDGVAFTGAPVWALDWCPQHGQAASQSTLDNVELLAVATHPKSQPHNKMGVALHGPGVIQLWAVPRSCASTLCPGGVPRALALILHDGCVAWGVRWCPNPEAFISTQGAGRYTRPCMFSFGEVCMLFPPAFDEE